MSREKSLIKTTGILAIGKLSSKLFTFFLLPLYTSMLAKEDFGTVDMIQTIITLSLLIVTLQIESGVFRFMVEKRDDFQAQSIIVSSCFYVLLFNSVIYSLLVSIINIFWTIPHFFLLILCFWTTAISSFLLHITRGKGQNLLYSIVSCSITLISLLVNIILIVVFKFGAESILIAMIVSNIIGSLIIFIKDKIWELLSLNNFKREKLKEILNYTVPLVPNAISWWIANASDRVLIVMFLGPGMNGIYAAANKIPAIYTNIYTVYNSAWTETMALNNKDSDIKEFIQNMMDKNYKLLSFLAFGIVVCISLFFKILIGEDYSEAYVHIYILMIAIFINSLCSLYGGIFSGYKESKVVGITTCIGAIVNVLVNLFLIRRIGLYAASLSTLISYFVILISRIIALKKYVDIKLSIRFTFEVILILLFVSFGYFSKILWLNILILVCLIVWGIIRNKEIILSVIQIIKKKIKVK